MSMNTPALEDMHIPYEVTSDKKQVLCKRVL